jgi:fructan beta-fructosidase
MKFPLFFNSILALALLFFAFGCGAEIKEQDKQDAITDAHRPLYHFTPDSMWMNDPNGMVYYDGEYHLFYQYYPDSTVWGPMHWGHAISTDLIHWEHMPVALYPDVHGWIFSGSAVVDFNNTSGLGSVDKPAMVAIFTYHDPIGERAGNVDFQTQGIAYSTDRGRTWKMYENNPVLKNPGIRDFRDPKVMWHDASGKWIMTLAVMDHIRFYSSPDLINWNFESEFGKELGAHGGVWECPDLIEMTVENNQDESKWVLLVSINPGGPNGGSATQYFVGTFDGSVFTSESKEIQWLDYGKDNYAGVTYANIPDSDGRKIFIGWMSNWEYATVVPTEKWRSAMTIPRTLELYKHNDYYKVHSLPVSELHILREDEVKMNSINITGIEELEGKSAQMPEAMELKLELVIPDGSTATAFGLEFYNTLGEYISIGYDRVNSSFFINRNNSGKVNFSENFSGIHKAPFVLNEGEILDMHIYLDIASVELFAMNGEVVMTEIFFPNENFKNLRFFSKDGETELRSGSYYPLKSSKKK